MVRHICKTKTPKINSSQQQQQKRQCELCELNPAKSRLSLSFHHSSPIASHPLTCFLVHVAASAGASAAAAAVGTHLPAPLSLPSPHFNCASASFLSRLSASLATLPAPCLVVQQSACVMSASVRKKTGHVDERTSVKYCSLLTIPCTPHDLWLRF